MYIFISNTNDKIEVGRIVIMRLDRVIIFMQIIPNNSTVINLTLPPTFEKIDCALNPPPPPAKMESSKIGGGVGGHEI